MLPNHKVSVTKNSKLLIILAVGSLTTMTGGVIAPVLPEMVQQLNLEPGLAANLVSVHFLTLALFTPPLGILADRTGRLRVLLCSLAFYALFGVAGGFITNIKLLLIVRGLLGIVSGGIAAASLGILGNLYEGEARSQALSYATSTLTITGILFPLLGGWVGADNWRYTFYLYAISLPLALLAALLLREKQPKRAKAKGSQDNKLSLILSQPSVVETLLMLSLAAISMTTVVIYAPLYLRTTIGVGSLLNGVVLASRAVGAAIVSAFGARQLAQRWGGKSAISAGFVLMAATLATIPLLHQLSWILITAVFFGVGFGLVLPNLYSNLADLAPTNLRSSVLAAGTGAGFLGQFLAPVVMKPVLNFGELSDVFYVAAAIALGSGVWLLVSRD